jgi:ERCC4-type nuclease
MLHDIFQQKTKSKKTPTTKKKKIIIDFREKNSLVPSKLIKQNLSIEFRELKIGDYLVKDTIIERKTTNDFLASMIDRRLHKQIKEMKQYQNYLLIVEGTIKENKLTNPLRGLILSLNLYHKIPTIFTKDEEETANYIRLLSNKKAKEISPLQSKSNLTPEERRLYILQAFPNIGPTKSKQLLKKFNSLKNIINANEKELEEIMGKHSKELIRIID